jgi:Xaa-Pro dipeptidase
MNELTPITEEPTAGADDPPVSDRRREIEAKQNQVGGLLTEAGADGLLLLDPANIAWFAGASLTQGIADPADWPALYLNANQRWLVSGSLDTQRIFDQHLDGLGFQLKEWPWHWGRERLLSDIRQNRRVASDRVMPEVVPLGPSLRRIRCTLTAAEQSRLRDLGRDVAHALEATCRALTLGQTEDEVAGQIAHRLVRRGIHPVALSVAADGRANRHPRPGVTSPNANSSCVVGVTAMRFGLHVTATRSVHFGPPTTKFRAAADAACRIVAALTAAGIPGTAAAAVLQAGERVAKLGGHDDAWRSGPPGHVTGWLPIERPLPAGTSMMLAPDWAVTWRAAIGPVIVADTYLVAGPPIAMTPVEPGLWPIMRITVKGQTLDMPDVFVRKE